MSERNHIDQRIQDLLFGSIDGELSAADQHELDKLLASSGEIRDLHEELKAFSGLLDTVPDLEPPQHLQKSIERQIRLPVQNTRHEEKEGFFGTWLPAHWLQTGVAVMAGAVLTIGVYQMGSAPISPEDASNLVGTVVKSPATAQGELLDSIHIFTDTLNGRVELRARDDLFSLDVQLDSEGPAQLVVGFAGRGLAFEGISRTQDDKDIVSMAEGTVNVTSSGEKRYTINLRSTADANGQEVEPLELEFFANHLLVHEAELNISER